VELVSAVIGAIGGLFQYAGVDRQARAAETIAREREATARAWYDTLVEGWLSQERIQEIQSWFARDVAWEEGDVQRTRIFYNYQALVSARGVVIALAGAGLVGLALYLAAKEEA